MSIKSLFSARDMTLGSPWKRIAEFAFPMLLGNFAQQLYNTADSVIVGIYNLDGPGFTESMLKDPGYLAIVPRIHTYIPESSVIGMLLEHEEAYSVIKSRQIGLLQHEPYSWEVMGGDFVHVQEISAGNRFADRTIKNWIRDMTKEDREILVQTIFELIRSGGASEVKDLLHPKNIHAFFKNLKNNPRSKKVLAGEFLELMRAIRETVNETKSQP